MVRKLLIVILFMPYILHAQKNIEGYVVDQHGDTIRGWLKYYKNDQRFASVGFKSSSDD